MKAIFAIAALVFSAAMFTGCTKDETLQPVSAQKTVIMNSGDEDHPIPPPPPK